MKRFIDSLCLKWEDTATALTSITSIEAYNFAFRWIVTLGYTYYSIEFSQLCLVVTLQKQCFSFLLFSFSLLSIFQLLFFNLISLSFLFYLIFEIFYTTRGTPSERAKISPVSFTFTFNYSKVSVRGYREASLPAPPYQWTRVYVLGTLQVFHITFFLCIDFDDDHFWVAGILAWAPLTDFPKWCMEMNIF